METSRSHLFAAAVLALGGGLLGLVLMIAGSAPASAANAGRAGDPDGLAIISVALCLYASAAVAVRLPGVRTAAFPAAAAA